MIHGEIKTIFFLFLKKKNVPNLEFLTHCRLNELTHTTYWKFLISILGMWGYVIKVFWEKNGTICKQWRDWSVSETPHSAASDLGLYCLPITLLGVSRLQWVKWATDTASGKGYLYDIYYGYSLEASQGGASNEYPQDMFFSLSTTPHKICFFHWVPLPTRYVFFTEYHSPQDMFFSLSTTPHKICFFHWVPLPTRYVFFTEYHSLRTHISCFI